ncbi:hypothetical protein [Nitrosomonas mobilis]|uniref:Uncharacterized protein n=1 Tax=Nitrosomonas mobilis TaxID=51642 RepID=A0A1G5SCR4_9PROT|nr:hypothetical protein [Nitrosomonas mobilis]SCZ84777.1 conserved membrane hypothetical protein [Nitrosomonas mobilis]
MEWWNHPAVQSALAPFLVALMVAFLLDRIRLSGLAILAGFCTVVYLVADFNFESLTVTRKIILTGIVTGAIAPVLASFPSPWRMVRYLLGAGAAVAALWIFWPILIQKQLMESLMLGTGLVLFVTWQVVVTDGLYSQPIRAGAAGMGMGIGVGFSALLGASASLSQLGLAIGAASGAYLCLQFIQNKPLSCGRTFTLPVSLLPALLASAALVLAKLPWYCLPALALIPLAAYLPIMRTRSCRIQIIVFSLMTMLVAVAATSLAWYAEGVVLW